MIYFSFQRDGCFKVPLLTAIATGCHTHVSKLPLSLDWSAADCNAGFIYLEQAVASSAINRPNRFYRWWCSLIYLEQAVALSYVVWFRLLRKYILAMFGFVWFRLLRKYILAMFGFVWFRLLLISLAYLYWWRCLWLLSLLINQDSRPTPWVTIFKSTHLHR